MTTRLPVFVHLARDLAFLAALALLAAVLGLATNPLRRPPLPWVYASKSARLQQSVARLAAAVPPAAAASTPAPAELIDLARFHDLVESGTPVLDARPPLFYRAGHVPGARGLSREHFEADYAQLRPFLEPHRHDALAIYCAGDECEDSRLVAAALQRLGYTQIFIYTGGWDEWRQAGLPEERP